MRIRCLKPEFPHSATMGHVSRDARLLFILTWTLADDEGRLNASPRYLAHVLFPYDSDAEALMPRWLEELVGAQAVAIYGHNGTQYLQILKWASHQKIDHPKPSRIPSPSEVGAAPAN